MASRVSSRVSGRSARPSWPPCAAAAGVGDLLVRVLGAAELGLDRRARAWSRQTLSLTFSPGADMPIRLDRLPERTTGSPLTSVITSPDFSPAAAAALPGATLAISAPSGRFRPKESASDWFRSCTVTPSRACVALPVATIWSFTFSATSIGIANDRPW